jgi:arylsulfatase A-like enzyme
MTRERRSPCRLAARVLAVVAVVALAVPADAAERSELVVVLLFDGFAPALVDRHPTPTLHALRTEGAWTHEMVPPFPSISFVGQTTIATGCWPEHHGIVSNRFFDPVRGPFEHARDADWLAGCEWLQTVSERQGIRTASLGWVGSFSETRGALATDTSPERRWKDFPSDAERETQVLELLSRPPATRPRLILAYFREPDHAAHFTGMDSATTAAAVTASDAVIGRILAALRRIRGATLIVTTDHGMLPVSTDVNVAKILANHRLNARFVSAGTTSLLYFDDPAERDRAARELAGYDAFTVVPRDAQPPDWHLGTGPRVGDLILSARPPYFIEDVHLWPPWARWLATWGPELLWAKPFLRASHGYPPATTGVAGIFYAWGAGVATGRRVPAIRAIDIHPTIARLLAIAPGAGVDGTAVGDVAVP